MQDVRAADLLATGHHGLSSRADLPVSRIVLDGSPAVEPESAPRSYPDAGAAAGRVTGAELPLGVTFPTQDGAGQYLGSFRVTCYALEGITFSGQPVALDGVAVDPAVIAIGESVYIDGLGWKVARDTGGLIIDQTIDIWNPSRDWCIQWGVQYLDVWAAPQ